MSCSDHLSKIQSAKLLSSIYAEVASLINDELEVPSHDLSCSDWIACSVIMD